MTYRKPDKESTGIPRWAKVTGIVVPILVVLFIGAQFIFGGGEFGPGQHG